MRTIGVVTTSRSEYGIYRPILRRIVADPDLRLMLFVGGMHLSKQFGMTINDIKQDGFPIDREVEFSLESDTPEGMSQALGAAAAAFAKALSKSRPDILLVLGDRFEMFAAASAAVPLNIPLAHIHGGELTYGAIDDAFRHAITKMSHLHFASAKTYADRIVRMGEEPWRVTVSGAPALDELRQLPRADQAALEKRYGFRLSLEPLLVTFHPVTRELDQLEEQVRELCAALEQLDAPVIFTQPNADAGGRTIQLEIERFVEKKRGKAWYVSSFGSGGYGDVMRLCAAVVGNSSSGIIEAPSFEVPVVNIGTRQDGRVRAANVINTPCSTGEIVEAIERAIAPEFRASLKGMSNPYGDGHASERIVGKLKSVELGDKLLRKFFHEEKARPTIRVVGIGAGGHAKVVIDILRQMGGYETVSLVDRDQNLQGSDVSGVRVYGDDNSLPELYDQGIREAFIGVGAIGDPEARIRVYESARRHGFRIVRAIHPTAVVAASAEIGDGPTIMANAIINPYARLGDNVIVNTRAVVEHDCVIGAHAHIAPGAVLSGSVIVGRGAHIGAGATVKQGLTIGAGAIVGAGAVVVRDVPAGVTVVGIPAEPLSSKVRTDG